MIYKEEYAYDVKLQGMPTNTEEERLARAYAYARLTALYAAVGLKYGEVSLDDAVRQYNSLTRAEIADNLAAALNDDKSDYANAVAGLPAADRAIAWFLEDVATLWTLGRAAQLNLAAKESAEKHAAETKALPEIQGGEVTPNAVKHQIEQTSTDSVPDNGKSDRDSNLIRAGGEPTPNSVCGLLVVIGPR